MRRSIHRLLAVVILALLGAPLAVHVVVHDLDQNHHEYSTPSHTSDAEHSDHEHPIVSSATLQVPTLANTQGTREAILSATPAARSGGVSHERDFVALGALRIDDDIGLHSFLSTFLI